MTATFLAAHAVQAAEYLMEGATIQEGASEITGGEYIFEGGLAPAQVDGTSADNILQPLAAKPYCGDGVRQTNETCDGADLNGATCASQGFTAGTLSCNASCAFDTSACTSSAGTTGGSGGDDGGGGRRPPTEPLRPSAEAEPPAQPGEPSAPFLHFAPFGTAPEIDLFRPPAARPRPSVPRNIVTIPAIPSVSVPSPLEQLGTEAIAEALPAEEDASCPLCIIDIMETGILARLVSLGRFEQAFASIPAYQMEAMSPLTAMRPGAMRADLLLWPFGFLRRRKAKKNRETRV